MDYYEKHALFEKGENICMSDALLPAHIAQDIAAQATPVVESVWQGAGPTAYRQVERAAVLR
jgi:hypothetical protein